MNDIDWMRLFITAPVLLGILLTPYELLMVIQRIWLQRRQDRIARGEDVRPQKLPWDIDD